MGLKRYTKGKTYRGAVKKVKATATKVGKKYGKQIVSVLGDALAPATFGASKIVASSYNAGRTAKEQKRKMEQEERRALRAEQAWLEANAPAKSNMFTPLQYAPPASQSGAHTPIRRGGVVGWFNRFLWGT